MGTYLLFGLNGEKVNSQKTEEMDRVSEGFILHTFDLDEIEEERRSWGLFRDRRPEIYLKE